MKPNDTVGTVVEAVTANMNVIAECNGTTIVIQVADNIPSAISLPLEKFNKERQLLSTVKLSDSLLKTFSRDSMCMSTT